MLSPLFLVATLTLALAIAANPLAIRKPAVTLSVAKHLNVTGTFEVVRQDRARARRMMQPGAAAKLEENGLVSDAVVDVTAFNGINFYYMDVSIMLFTVIQRALMWFYIGWCWHSRYYM